MDEKWEEKELEKREEKSPEEKDHGEKNYEEKYRRDPLGSIVWAAILIWCGLVFLANNLGFMDKIQPVFDFLPKAAESWEIDVPFITFGAIQIFLLGTAFIFSIVTVFASRPGLMISILPGNMRIIFFACRL